MYVDGSYLEVFLLQNILGKQTLLLFLLAIARYGDIPDSRMELRHESEIHKKSWEVFF